MCTEKAPHGPRFTASHPKPWALKAQSLVRDIRSPFKPPSHCYIRLSQDGSRVDAVIAFYDEPMPENQHHFHLNVLARHLDCADGTLGIDALHTFTEQCYDIVESLPDVKRIVLTAEAHKANLPVRRLLAETPWQLSSDVNPDPNYENWERIIDVAPAAEQEEPLAHGNRVDEDEAANK